VTDAILANSAIDFLIGYFMGQIRTTNKRHKRALIARQSPRKPAQDSKKAATPSKEKA